MKLDLFYQSLPIVYDILYIGIIYHFGLIKGCFLIWSSYKTFTITMKYIFNLEKGTPGDMVLMWCKYEDVFNISIVAKGEEMNPIEMREYIIENVIKCFPKLRVRLVFKLFCFWWKGVSLEEAIARIEIVNDPKLIFKTEKDLNEYVSKRGETKLRLLEEMPYKIIILKTENSEKTLQNVIIINADHALGDGGSLAGGGAGASSNYSNKLFPAGATKKLSLFWSIYIKLLFPYNILRIAYNYLIRVRRICNPFEADKPQVGIPKIALTKPLDFNKLHELNKKLNITFNTGATSILISGLKKFSEQEGNYKNDYINIYSPTAMKSIPLVKEDIEITNNTGGFGSRIHYISDPLTQYQHVTNDYSKYINDYALVYCQKVITDWVFQYLPFYGSRIGSMFILHNFDILFSNVPGSKETLYYGKSKAIDMYPMLTSGLKSSFICLFSYCGKCRYVISGDKSLSQDPEMIAKAIDNEVDRILSKSLD